MKQVSVLNQTKERLLARSAEMALSLWERCRGLLGRKNLLNGSGLILKPCQSIHTFFMAFPIDVVFADRENRVIGWQSNMRPFRISRWYRRALWALELPAGTLTPENLEKGDLLVIRGEKE
ncbi:MAG: DUF192 domain-containing protein [Deltaproteobacteria bacterium]|nr:DUF192 domain-containing protein [Deltaproteobacteria bacterium]